MTNFTDRNGNTMEFKYEEGKLRFVYDTLGREIEYFYEGNHLTRVRDFFGREIHFDYDTNGDLVAVTGPSVEGTPHGNDFPSGKTERYTYSPGTDNYRHMHNLLTVTAPNEVAFYSMPREVYVYDENDRVIEQINGGINQNGVPAGGKFKYSHTIEIKGRLKKPSDESSDSVDSDYDDDLDYDDPHKVHDTFIFLPVTLVTDRNGNSTLYKFNGLGNISVTQEFTNRDIRVSDPPSYDTAHHYYRDGQRLETIYHEGNSIEYSFAPQGNLLKEIRRADSDRGGDQSEIIKTYSYEPIYNQLQKATDARGYITTYTFDYQEGSDYTHLAMIVGKTPVEVETALKNAKIDMGLGDVNGDGRTDQIAGNVIRITQPTVNLPSDSNQAKVEGGTTQEIIKLFVYNDFGQLVRETDSENNVTTYEYYSERDPDGDGNSKSTGDRSTGGYLKQITRDTSSDSRRDSGSNPRPTNIRTLYKYDPVGNVTQEVDGRGIVTDYVVNELNQVVQIVRDAGYVPFTDPRTIEGVSQDFKYIECFWYDFNNNLVLHQKEDRGNTSNVDGNPPDFLNLPIEEKPLRIDFEEGTDGTPSEYQENGFVFLPVHPGSSVQLFTESGDRGLRLMANSVRERVRVRRADGASFTLSSFRIDPLIENHRGDWVAVSSAGGEVALPRLRAFMFAGSEWTNIVEFELYPTVDVGDILIDDFRMFVTPDSVGDDRAFVDVVYKYDIMDNRIETIQEVQNGLSPHFLRTRYRYDANENLTLTILPEGNFRGAIYDERDLLFRQGSGAQKLRDRLEGGVSSGGNTIRTFQDNSKSWTVDKWAGRTLWISAGTGKGLVRTIVSNTDTVLIVSPNWDTIPDATSEYEISPTLLAPGDPTDYDVRGGFPCECRSNLYDGNRNLIETVDSSDTDLSTDNNNPDLGHGDRTRYIYDGFDRQVSVVDAVGNQLVYQYDEAGNITREVHFGPTGGPSPTSDGPNVLPGPVSINGVIQRANLVNPNPLSCTEYLYDELGRKFQTDQVLFVNTSPILRTPDVADGATDLGKDDLTPEDNQAIPGISGITIAGRVSTRTEFDRKSRPTFTVEDDGDTSCTFYDGVDRVIKTVNPEGNTIESAYDDDNNLIEQRQIDLSQEVTGEGGKLQAGQSTGSNDVRTLNDTTKSWHPYEWAGRTLQITGGTGAGQVRKIIDNTSKQLTIGEKDWDITPDATSTYAILPISLLENGKSTGENTVNVLNDGSKTWTDNEWKGRTIEITGGKGSGQIRKITSNYAQQLSVNPAWDEIPDASSRYAIYPRPQPGIAEVFLTTYYYDHLNRLQRQSDNLGQTTYYRYDSRNNLVAIADAQGPTDVTFTCCAFSNGPRTVNTTNRFGNVTLYYYDGMSRKTRQEIYLTASGSGDGIHIGASVEGVKNDARILESLLPAVDVTKGGGDGIIRIGTTYDDNSLISSQIDDQGNVTLYLYDNLDRRVTETKGLTTATGPLTKELILGSREIVTPSADKINNPPVISTDKINTQLAGAKLRIDTIASLFPPLADRVDDNPPTTIVHGYDPDSNILITEDEYDNEVFVRYDAINRPIALRVFRAGQSDYHRGDTIFAPNPVNDPSNSSNAFLPVEGTTKQNFQYDGLSRPVMAMDNNDPLDGLDDSVVTYAFDSLNRLIEESQQIGAYEPKIISNGWRAGNLRSALTYPNGRVIRYTYGGIDQINTIANDTGTERFVDYNYIGNRVLERLYPINNTRMTCLDDNGTADIGYDGLGRQTQLRHLRGDNSLIVGFAHTYDRMNNKLTEDKLHAPSDSELYSYDSAYRLIGFQRGTLNASKDAIVLPSPRVPQQSRWTLDGAGNWTRVDDETRKHSSFNEIVSRDTTTGTRIYLEHNDNGNLCVDGNFVYKYDFMSRLIKVNKRADGQLIAEYNYDAMGRRIRKIITNSGSLDGTTLYYYSNKQIIEEHKGTEQLSEQYIYGNYIDEVLVMDSNLDTDDTCTGPNDQRLFYHQNSLMSVYALTDSANKIVEGYLYDAYGSNRSYEPGANGVIDFGGDDEIVVDGANSLSNPYLFTGRYFDPETGLLYYRARYLDPDLGRFISRDPIDYWQNVNNFGNDYTYTANNPVNNLGNEVPSYVHLGRDNCSNN